MRLCSPSVWAIDVDQIPGIDKNVTYYAIVNDGFRIQLAPTLTDAQNGTNIVEFDKKYIFIEMREDIDVRIEHGVIDIQSDQHVYFGQ